MLYLSDVLFKPLPFDPERELALGRNIKHDPRSKAFAFEGAGITYKSVKHTRHIPVLDQGQLGSCTGNAATGCIGSGDFYGTLPAGKLSASDANFDEQAAVRFYSRATVLDSFQQDYPPNDTGSDGLSVAKAVQEEGLIAGYQHAFSLDDTLKALTLQPIIIGVNWYSSFDNPNSSGLVSIGRSAQLEGGHEFVLDEINAEKKLVGATNSWTTAWGAGGRFYFSFATLERLLSEQGDVTVFVKNDVTPAPGPVNPLPPVPTGSPEDLQLIMDFKKWMAAKGLS